MKRLAAILILLVLLLAGCGETLSPEGKPTEPVPSETRAGAELAGTWENRGQYSEGRDFVETMTLEEDGDARIHLDYQGKPYADLEGRWTVLEGELIVTFRDENTRDRRYAYALEDGILTLTGGEKTVTYRRIH